MCRCTSSSSYSTHVLLSPLMCSCPYSLHWPHPPSTSPPSVYLYRTRVMKWPLDDWPVHPSWDREEVSSLSAPSDGRGLVASVHGHADHWCWVLCGFKKAFSFLRNFLAVSTCRTVPGWLSNLLKGIAEPVGLRHALHDLLLTALVVSPTSV